MATAPAGGGSAKELSYITELLAKSQPGRALPTVILCCEDEEAEVKILVHLVRCRASGSMGILPALDLVSRVLDGMVNAEGDPLAVFRDVTIAVLDSGGRKFGNADVLLVDFSAECVGQFRRGPALRSAGGAGIFRLRVGEAVARPAPRSAWEAAEAWIQEMAEQDGSMQEYLTAQEEDPPGDGADVPSGGDAAVVAQLQARILELESQQATPVQTPPARPPLHFEPPLRDPVQGALFGDLPRGGASVNPGVLKQLQSMAGPAPSRLSRLEAKPKAKAEPTAAQNAQAELDAGVLQEEELAALAQGGDPLHRILALQLQQTAALTQRLTSRMSSDPITNVLGSEGGSSNSNGVRGCVARDAYLRALTDIPGVGRIIMMNAASDLGLSELQIGSGLMRQYVERRVPLGDHRLLTYMAQFMACSWQVAYDHQDELALGLFARGLMLIEQISLDKGRCQFGWLLTGFTEPDLAQISMHKQRLGIKPYAKLAAAPWVAANVAYLRDIDFLETRLRSASSTNPGNNVDKEKEDADPKGWRKKKKGQNKEDAESTTAS